ncbi:MAG: glycoside hydrolase family 3 C-terminal domain-containing protein [Tidjanibacter sp.]|nr:glycoside hydrolase family 3 C-terminal domain-containing protein [Tidjanibacter sp.]
MKFIKTFAIIGSLMMMVGCCGSAERQAIPTDKDLEAQVKEIVSNMTLEEKVGQMAEIGIDILGNSTTGVATAEAFILKEDVLDSLMNVYKIGSVLNAPGKALDAAEWNRIIEKINDASIKHTGVPTLYGIDAIHGTTYTSGATLFPQEVNAAASFNRALTRNMAEMTAYEVRASNIPWTYSPTLDLGRRHSWPRVWESFSEDAYLTAELGREMVLGYQGTDPNNIDKYHIAACPKHFLAYGMTNSGQDRTPAYVSIAELKEKHFAPFKAAIEAGALSIMVNSASVNGIPTHADHELLTVWLKEGLGWDGVIVSDWSDVPNLYTRENIAKDYKEAIVAAVNAGMDMAMIPYDLRFCTYLIEAVNEGLVSEERVTDAAERIVRMKARLGLLDTPNTYVADYPKFQGEEIREAAYNSATESITLLKNNNNILPIKRGAKVLVTGPNANKMRPLCGGWSFSWQGDIVDERLPEGVTFYKALRAEGGSNVQYVPSVEYVERGSYDQERVIDIQAAVRAARSVDYIILCLGENSYCETPGNLKEMAISENQQALAKALAATGKPIILVLNEGRNRIIRSFVDEMDAVLHTFLPGTEGGRALASIIYGDVNPSGKLPHSYPKYSNAMTTYDHKVSESVGTMQGAYDYDAVVDLQWAFGYGLSYTTFAYSNLKVLEGAEFAAGDTVRISVDVTNTGKRAGKESVLLFINDDVASIVPDGRRLRDFDKIELQPGETKTVIFEVAAEELAFAKNDANWYLEEGTYTVQCGDLVEKINCTENAELGAHI